MFLHEDLLYGFHHTPFFLLVINIITGAFVQIPIDFSASSTKNPRIAIVPRADFLCATTDYTFQLFRNL